MKIIPPRAKARKRKENKMTLTTKETELLKDMKEQEELCIKKYNKYSSEAKCGELKNLLSSIATAESSHLSTINDMLAGKEPSSPAPLSENIAMCKTCPEVYKNTQDKEADSFICQDLLATEKHVSALYNTGVFEFKSPAARKMLNHIQAEEQQHGEKLYAFMSCNGMYN
jgi:spore coat protein CotF